MNRSLPDRQRPSLTSNTTSQRIAKQVSGVAIVVFAALACFGQEQTPTVVEPQSQPNQAQASDQSATVTIPAGTRFALVITQPIQTRYLHRGDDIYAQINAPVTSGNEVVMPIGTFVQGRLDRLEFRQGRGELHLESMSVTFPDSYVVPISGPATLEIDEGYTLKDPGSGRAVGAFLLPAGGAGLGALIGHFAANAHSTTITQTLPPNCGVPTPGCTNGTSQSLTIPGNTGKATVIGAAVGGTIGMVSSLALLFSSHHFFLAAGTPAEMTLQQPVSLKEAEVAAAVQQSEQNPAPQPPVAPLPQPPANTPADHGTCWTPGTPGTPPTIVPGVVGPDGTIGPPTIIPGTPPTPGTPYPCP